MDGIGIIPIYFLIDPLQLCWDHEKLHFIDLASISSVLQRPWCQVEVIAFLILAFYLVVSTDWHLECGLLLYWSSSLLLFFEEFLYLFYYTTDFRDALSERNGWAQFLELLHLQGWYLLSPNFVSGHSCCGLLWQLMSRQSTMPFQGRRGPLSRGRSQLCPSAGASTCATAAPVMPAANAHRASLDGCSRQAVVATGVEPQAVVTTGVETHDGSLFSLLGTVV